MGGTREGFVTSGDRNSKFSSRRRRKYAERNNQVAREQPLKDRSTRALKIQR